jgi:hypothetical protein
MQLHMKGRKDRGIESEIYQVRKSNGQIDPGSRLSGIRTEGRNQPKEECKQEIQAVTRLHVTTRKGNKNKAKDQERQKEEEIWLEGETVTATVAATVRVLKRKG